MAVPAQRTTPIVNTLTSDGSSQQRHDLTQQFQDGEDADQCVAAQRPERELPAGPQQDDEALCNRAVTMCNTPARDKHTVGRPPMTDPLTVGMVTAAAGPLFTYLFGCLKDVRQRQRDHIDDGSPTHVPTPPEWKATTELIPDMREADRHADQLARLDGALGIFDRRPELRTDDDPDLRTNLDELQRVLQVVYGQPLPGLSTPVRSIVGTAVATDGGYAGANELTAGVLAGHVQIHGEARAHGKDSKAVGNKISG